MQSSLGLRLKIHSNSHFSILYPSISCALHLVNIVIWLLTILTHRTVLVVASAKIFSRTG